MNAESKKQIVTDALPLGSAGCCDAQALADMVGAKGQPIGNAVLPAADPSAFVRIDDDGLAHLDLWVENLSCAACINLIETTLLGRPGVTKARVNLSTRRLAITWHPDVVNGMSLVRLVTQLGYPVAPFDPTEVARSEDNEHKRLLSALAVAGFAAANVMLLSVSIWAGHSGGMEAGTRTLFHWVSAMIALPAVAYAGQPFFRSALSALKAGRSNMDVPISLAVILASAMSIYQTLQSAEHAYFDAAVMLLFFLLIGRYLDRRARASARSAAAHLLGLRAEAAMVVDETGNRHAMRAIDVKPGMTVMVAQGARLPVDGEVVDGTSDVDTSLINGESMAKCVAPGDAVFAGTLNMSAPIRVRATKDADCTLLADIVRLMETAEQGRARYVRLADRVARVYAPVVHVLAAATFIGWWVFVGAGWEPAMMAAIAVLIITCPCALGLAVPVVQVVASGRLLSAGVLVKSGDALEKLAQVDTVVFDKTGTLTLGAPTLRSGVFSKDDLALAAALADTSQHPLARAIAAAAGGVARPHVGDIHEVPGLGIEGMLDGTRIRLGRAAWCGVLEDEDVGQGSVIWLSRVGAKPARFDVSDALRPDVADIIQLLQQRGLHIEVLSGDVASAVAPIAEELGIPQWRAACLPGEKAARLAELSAAGHHVLMVGDGLNDAPSLSAAHVSMSPTSAADISQTTADLVFQGQSLKPIVVALDVARLADRLVKQNFVLAIAYNAVAVPLAVLGFVTPLLAAVAMSSSSILVTLNALRLRILK
tara:strand:- start:4243 stop:6540 length:2298 start_codon:yes stop_codon:yes gene_type:complete